MLKQEGNRIAKRSPNDKGKRSPDIILTLHVESALLAWKDWASSVLQQKDDASQLWKSAIRLIR